jgi:hypothetical protein
MAAEPQKESATTPDDAVNQGATGARRDGEHAARASDRSPGEHAARASDRSPGESPLSVESESDPFAERPEAFVGAAFAGGFALAMILRRFAR